MSKSSRKMETPKTSLSEIEGVSSKPEYVNTSWLRNMPVTVEHKLPEPLPPLDDAPKVLGNSLATTKSPLTAAFPVQNPKFPTVRQYADPTTVTTGDLEKIKKWMSERHEPIQMTFVHEPDNMPTFKSSHAALIANMKQTSEHFAKVSESFSESFKQLTALFASNEPLEYKWSAYNPGATSNRNSTRYGIEMDGIDFYMGANAGRLMQEPPRADTGLVDPIVDELM